MEKWRLYWMSRVAIVKWWQFWVAQVVEETVVTSDVGGVTNDGLGASINTLRAQGKERNKSGGEKEGQLF